VKERVFHGIPFAVVFVYWVVVACVGLKMEEMFLERNIGRLPGVTTALFRTVHFCADVPWAFGLAVLVLASGYLLWGAQTRERMRWTSLLMQGLLVLLVVVTLAALFAPLSMIGGGTR
jgi:type II secretory pathway component PulF